MSSSKKKKVFYLEDDADGLQDYYEVLRKRYDVSIGAHWDLIKPSRPQLVDLVIVDLMIHHASFDYETGKEVENICFQDVHWTRTGLEFFRRLRDGEYEQHGFSPDMPVIVATAVVNYPARDLTEQLGIASFLEKPFTIEELETAVDKALKPSNEQKR